MARIGAGARKNVGAREPGKEKEAQRLLLDAVHQGAGTLDRLRGLAPGTLSASEGMLFRKV